MKKRKRIVSLIIINQHCTFQLEEIIKNIVQHALVELSKNPFNESRKLEAFIKSFIANNMNERLVSQEKSLSINLSLVIKPY